MFIIEGNIGAGKSTFLTMLSADMPQLIGCTEPIDQWHNETHGKSLLEKFYQDPERWAYTLETFTLQCRVQQHINDQLQAKNSLCVVERSIFSGHYIFAANSHQFMNDIEWRLYNSLFSMSTQSCEAPLGFIYLQTDPYVAFDRIKKRQRSAEKTISLDYLIDIHQKHEELFSSSCAVLKDNEYSKAVPVLTINTNQDFENNEALFKDHLSKVKKFLRI